MIIGSVTQAAISAAGTMMPNVYNGNDLFDNVGTAIWQGAVSGAVSGAITSGSLQAANNYITGDTWYNKLGSSMLSGAIGGAINGGVYGFKLAQKMHANVLTGNLDNSLDYIMQKEYGGLVGLNYNYGINKYNEKQGKYFVAKKNNLPKGYSLKNKYILTPEGEEVQAFTLPRKIIENKIYSDVYFSRTSIRNYFINSDLSVIGHEMIHIKDILSGQDFINKYGFHTLVNYSEARAYLYSYELTKNLFYLEQAQIYQKLYLFNVRSTNIYFF